MKEVKAYSCEFCGKLFLRKNSCEEHEKNDCTKTPKNRALQKMTTTFVGCSIAQMRMVTISRIKMIGRRILVVTTERISDC